MSASYIGSTAVVTDISYKQKNDGVVEYQKRTLYRGDQTSISFPNIGDSIDGFSVVGVSVVKTDGSFFELVIRGESVGSSGSGGFNNGQLLRDATNSLSEEPIASAINFTSATSGLASIIDSAGGIVTQGQTITEGTGSIFTEDGEFVGFTKNAKKNLFGVQSYLNPTLTHRRRFSTTSKPSISAVGRIVNSAADFPSIESGRTWLCTNITYVLRGNTYEVTQEFRASGRGGWNQYIYGDPVSAPSAS